MVLRKEAWEPRGRRGRPARGRLLGLFMAPVFLALAGLLVLGYQRTLTPVTVLADGKTHTLRTHQTTVEAVLREAGVTIHPEDIVKPALSEQLADGETITVQRARAVVVEVDGRVVQGRTQLVATQQILAQLEVKLGQYDEVQVLSEGAGNPTQNGPLHIVVQRAMPVTVQEPGNPPVHFYTTASTVGEALYEAGIVLYLADDVRPSLSSPIKPGTRIAISRSVPVTVHADGQTLRTRTHRLTVGDVLADIGISLQGLDYAEPELNAALGEGREIRVVRAREELLVQQEPIPFETQWAPDPQLEIDRQGLGQPGEPGVYERRTRVRYEDGAEVDRWLEAEWVAKAPSPKILNYGTQVVLRTIDTPAGPRQYWRKFRMLATSYNAASAGKPPDHPRYGITRLGWQMRFGIVAVDPQVIRLGSQVYVPGYGIGDAADTGGAIKNMRIDLGYDDNNLVPWYRCVDVYVLAPAPDNIQYVMGSLVHPWCQ